MLKIIMLFSIILATASIPRDSFIDALNSGYEEYYLYLDEEREVGDLILAFGKVKGKYYLSSFLLNVNAQDYHSVQIIINDKDISTFVSDSGVVAGYGLQVKENDQFQVYLIAENSKILVGTYQANDLITSLKTNKITGSGTGQFPKNKKETNLIRTIRIYILVFILAVVLLSLTLVVLYKKAVGRFNKNHQEEPLFDFEKQATDDQNVIDVESEVIQENKQEIMDRLFEEYHHGDITEEELNKKLKKLWWNNNDEN